MTSRRPLTICVIGSSSSVHVVTRAQCFVDRGHKVFLVTDRRAGLRDITEVLPAEAVDRALPALGRLNAASLRLRGRPVRGLSLAGLVLGVPALIRRLRPDVVHVHFAYSPWAWMAALADFHPLVVSVMGGDILFEEQGSATAAGRWLTLQLLEAADLITAKSNHLIRVLDELGGFGAKAMRVVWGVDLERFRRTNVDGLRAELGIAADDRVILSPRILQPFYNVHLIIDAMPRIVEACPRARLLVTEYGAEDAYRQGLVQRTHTLGVDKHVQFIGHVAHSEMPQYYSLADVAVSVPPSDGVPQTLLEAMACGTPNVLSRLDRYEEVVRHEDSAYFVDATADGIADGVIRLLTDSAMHAHIARTGRMVAEQQADLREDVDRVEAEYYELLAARRRRRTNYVRRARLLHALISYWRRL